MEELNGFLEDISSLTISTPPLSRSTWNVYFQYALLSNKQEKLYKN